MKLWKGAALRQPSVQCRMCKKITVHHERIVTNNLPPNVAVLECTVCSVLGVVMLESAEVPKAWLELHTDADSG